MKIAQFITIALLVMSCGKDESTDTITGTAASETFISSNQLISPYGTDMCTQYTGEACVFLGGQRIKFTDGSIMITGSYRFVYFDGVSDTDSDQNTVTITIPPSIATSYQVLSSMVARGSGYKWLFLVYDRASDAVSLVYDTNGSMVYEASDTVLASPSIVNW